MAAQIRPRPVVVQAVGLLQLVEHGDKALRRKTRRRHQPIANAVGLALHVARKIELVLHQQGRPANHQRLRRRRAFAGRQRAQHHGAQHQRRLAPLVAHQAGNMALRYMAQLMRQHRSEFVAATDHAHQPQMHAQITARQRKGVHRAVAPQQHLPSKALVQIGRKLAARTRRRQQRLPQVVDIFIEHRVIDVVRVAVQLADDAVAQAAFIAQRQITAIAQRWQARLRRHRCSHGHGRRYY